MKNYLLCLGLFFIFHCQAQQRTLVQKTIDTLSFRQANRAYIDDIKYTLQNDSTVTGWTKYHTFRSYVHLYKGEEDSAIFHANKAIAVYDSIERGHWASDGLIHKAYYIIGLYQFFDGKLIQSLNSLNTGLEYCSKFPESPSKFTWKYYILARISVIHKLRGDYKLALEMRRATLEDIDQVTPRYEGGVLYASLGKLYAYLNNRDSAYYYYHQALKKLNDNTLPIEDNYPIESFYTNIMAVNNNLGDLHFENKDIDSALFYYEKAYQTLTVHKLSGENTFSLSRFSTRANMAYVLSQKDSLQSAIIMLADVRDSIYQLSEYTREERDLKLKTYNLLSDLYEQNTDYGKAIQSQKQLNEYLINYNEKSIADQLQLYSTQFGVKEKEVSILQLKKNANIQELVVKQKNIINWILGTLLISILGLGWLFIRQRQLKNKYRTANLEQRLLRSQLSPHFVFNSLNSAISLAEKKSDKMIPYLFKLSRLFRLVLKNSREEFVSLSEELQAVKDYLELESNFLQKFDYHIDLSYDIDSSTLFIPPMFIQPLVENAIEHGFQGKKGERIIVTICKSEHQNALRCIVEDNGIGYTNAMDSLGKFNKNQSFSGKILKERLKIYSQSFKIDTDYSIRDRDHELRGTSVNITIPFILDS